MDDLSRALRQVLHRKQQEMRTLENQLVVLRALIDVAEEPETVDPTQPIPPQRAAASAPPAKIVKRFP